jgi:hypothetical protein
MTVCSWAAGCAQETLGRAELCEYHEKVTGGLLGVSGELEKVAARRNRRRQREVPPPGETRPRE